MKRPWTQRLAGSALLLALMVVFAASFVLAGWAMMLATRTMASEEASVSQKRRISYQNARNIGMQWARNGLGGNLITNVTVTLTNDWGQFSSATVASNIMNTSIVDSRVNHFGPMPSIFTLPVSTTLVGGGVTNSNTFFFRSRSPLYGGYPLVAQTNTLGFTTNFSRISVATNGNGMALMYAQPGSLTNAPASTVYNASTNRTVATALGSAFPAPISAYPFTPSVSAPTGATAYSGQLTAAPPRTFTINSLRGAIDTAYGTNAPTVTDFGPFRALGSTAGFLNLIHFANPSGVIRHFLLINTIPGSNLNYNNGNNTYTLTAPGNHIYTISLLTTGGDAGSLRFVRNSNGFSRTLEADGARSRYLMIRSAPSFLNDTDRDPVEVDYNRNPLIEGSRISLTDNGSGGTSRLIGFELTNFDLVALHDKTAVSGDGNKHLTFTQTPGRGQATTGGAVVEGALIYRADAYGSSTGIFFLLMNGPLVPTLHDALNLLRPDNQLRIRCLVNGLPAIQIRTGNTPSFNYPLVNDASVNAITVEPSNATKIRLRPTTNQTPLLVHVEQDEFPADSTLQWRKVLMVFNTETALNVQTINSALTFSYFDTGDFDVGIDSGSDSTRPFNLSIAGRSNVNNTATRFVGGGGRTWNMGLTLRDSPATFELGANQTLRLIGGIRSNSRVEATPGTSAVVLERNTNPGVLDLFSDRMGWIETWRQ